MVDDARGSGRTLLVGRLVACAALVASLAVPFSGAQLVEGDSTYTGEGTLEKKDGRYLLHAKDGRTLTVLENSVLQRIVDQEAKGLNLTADVTNYGGAVYLLPKTFTATERGRIPEHAAAIGIKIVETPSDRAKNAVRDQKREEKKAEADKRKAEKEAEKREKEKEREAKGKRPPRDRKGGKDDPKDDPKEPAPAAAEEGDGDHDADPWTNYTPPSSRKVNPMPVAAEGTAVEDWTCEFAAKDGRTSVVFMKGEYVGFNVIVLESVMLEYLENELMTLPSAPTFVCSGKLTRFGDQNFLLIDAYKSAGQVLSPVSPKVGKTDEGDGGRRGK